jgi:tetraacyldisaccharide 4'-kinase
LKEFGKIPLLPLALIYGFVVYLRNRLYDLGLIRVYKPQKHTICVGNLSVGGSGKTPHVEYLIRLLKNEFRIATLSRGYKRKTKGFIIADENSTSADIGDEPLLYKTKHPDITVSVEANRVKAVKKLSSMDTPSGIILLDDAFQHRPIKCGLNILISEFDHIYFNDFLLPVGRLREGKGGAHRADIIIISKTPEKTTPVEIRNVMKDVNPLPHQYVFFSYLKYGELYSISNAEEKISTLNDLFRYRLVVFTGIANAEPMITYLKEYSAGVSHLPFNDHHDFTENDIFNIRKYYESFEGGNKLIVTTEKDLMRLKQPEIWTIAERMNIFVLPVEVTFKDKTEEFNEIILKYARTNRIYHQKYT